MLRHLESLHARERLFDLPVYVTLNQINRTFFDVAIRTEICSAVFARGVRVISVVIGQGDLGAAALRAFEVYVDVFGRPCLVLR